jgi:transposase
MQHLSSADRRKVDPHRQSGEGKAFFNAEYLRVKTELAKVKAHLARTNDQIEQLSRELAEAKTALGSAQEQLTRAKEESAQSKAELVKVKEKLVQAETERTEMKAALRQKDVELEHLRGELAESKKENAALKKQLEEQERLSKRQAAPFSKGKKKRNPKKPGRKAGKGKFARRQPPAPEDITRTVDVPLGSERCPFCNSANLSAARMEHAYRTDIADPPKPEVTDYRIEVRTCLQCGRTIRGQHPQVDPTQYGASAHRLGDGVLARAHVLHYGLGIPMRKVPVILRELCGVSVTQSALQQDAIRRSKGEVGAEYARLRAGVKDSKRVFTDDTGWRIDGEPAQMMGFDTDEACVYQVRRQHRNEEVREIIPSDYTGIMHTDRGGSYDAWELEMVAQQKCCYHLIRSIEKVLERKTGPPRAFGKTLAALIDQAIELWQRYQRGDTEHYATEAKQLIAAFDRHLTPRDLGDPDNQRLLDQIGWHHAGGNLLRFLEQPDVAEPTNNRAERALRSAVIARKVSHCSKNEAGAHAYEAFKSVLETIRKKGQSMVSGLINLFGSSKQTASAAS